MKAIAILILWMRISRISIIIAKKDTDIILNLHAAFFNEGYGDSYSLDENKHDQYNNSLERHRYYTQLTCCFL